MMLSLLPVQEELRQRSASRRCLYFPLKHFESHFSCTILGHEMSSGVQTELEPQQPVCSLLSAWRHRRRGNSKTPGPWSSELNFCIPFGSRSREAGTVCLCLPQPRHTHGAHTSHQCFPPGPRTSCFLGPGTAYTLVGTNLAF